MRKTSSDSSLFAKATAILLDQISEQIPSGLEIDGLISGYRDPSELFVTHAGQLVREAPLDMISEYLAQAKRIEIPAEKRIWVANSCATGNACLGLALHKIRLGKWRRAMVHNLEIDSDLTQMSWMHLFGALATEGSIPEKVSRPFAKDRRGFVKSDGGVVFLIEEMALARSRGAHIYGEVAGYGGVADAFRLTEGRPDAEGVEMAMRLALKDAGISPSDVGCVSAHATSTPMGDALEVKAIESLFGSLAASVPVTALKSQLGHATFASGGLQALACMLMLQDQKIPPILNLEADNMLQKLNFVIHTSRSARMNYVLSNNVGFGGQNAALVLRRHADVVDENE
ncbi:MAG: beta-ketoacyl-[acyl-carrier-protein] synthase family protein [Bdellovibrionota bacterium]